MSDPQNDGLMLPYERRDHADNDLLGPWHQAVLKHYDFTAKNVLDVGAGAGRFLEAIRDKAASVHGIDPNPHNGAAMDALGIANTVGYLDGSLSYQPDVATCFEVIEHVYDANPIIASVADVLRRRGGTLIVSTPNAFNAMRAIKFVIHQQHHDPLMDPVVKGHHAEHIRGFSFNMVERLMRNHGFRNIRPLEPQIFRRYLAKNVILAGDIG